VLERLRGCQTTGARCGDFAVPGGVGAEVALPRSHLVKAARSKLVEAHERVGLQRGAERVPGRVWSSLVPFFHEEVLALKLELWVGAARGGLGIEVAEEVLRGDREGVKPVLAQKEKHRVGESVEGEVGPILGGRSGLGPREGQAAARIPRAQGPEVWRVAVKGRSLHRGGEPRGCGVDLWRGAEDPKVSQPAFIREEEIEWREAGLNGQDVRGGAHEAVGRPSLDLVQERGELPGHVDRWNKGVRAIAEDGKEEGGGKSVTEVRGEANSWGGETFNRHEGSLGFGQPLDKVGGGGDRGREPVA